MQSATREYFQTSGSRMSAFLDCDSRTPPVFFPINNWGGVLVVDRPTQDPILASTTTTGIKEWEQQQQLDDQQQLAHQQLAERINNWLSTTGASTTTHINNN
jgi:hypothetical protein